MKTPSTDRFLRRLLNRGIVRLAGGAGLVGGVMAAPLILACSCPSHVEWQVRTLPESGISGELDDEACHELCQGNALSCRIGRAMPEGYPTAGPEVAVQVQPLPDSYQGGDLEAQHEAPEQPEPVVICEVRITQPCGIGRRPDGLQTATVAAREPLGAYLAEAAHLEAASVVAFVELAFELEAHGVPAPLVEAAQRAALEEVRHAAMVGELARAFGQPPVTPTATLGPPRELRPVLETNRIEGMVGESYGAAVAAVQARRAATPLLRAVMGTVARDEARHATLARQVHQWGAPKLGRSARRALDDDGGAATERLARELEAEPTAPVLGLPSATEAQTMVAALG
jgi:hypothetical protein